MSLPTNIQSWRRQIPETLTNAFRSGDPPILFLGAGLGREACPPLDSAYELCERLRKDLSISTNEGEGLSELLQYYKNQEVGAKREVYSWLKNALLHGFAKPGGAHLLLASLPAREFLTTNYDLLLDAAAQKVRKTVCNAIDATDFRTNRKTKREGELLVGRIHGVFNQDGSIVATTDDYIGAFEKRNWRSLFEEYAMSDRLLFIGYSLKDFNIWTSFIAALLQSDHQMSAHVLVSPSSSQHVSSFWKNYHIHHIPLKAHQFLIGLHDALGTLESSTTVALAAAAACRQVSIDQIEEDMQKEASECRLSLLDASLRCVLTTE